jgi:F0F1-type ATP synthase membrane subunit b/b'
MSDILDKLLGVEKKASVLAAEAEAEANRRKTRARVEAQKEYTEGLARKAREIERRLEDAREGLKLERERKNREYTDGLKKSPQDSEAFRRAFLSFVSKQG